MTSPKAAYPAKHDCHHAHVVKAYTAPVGRPHQAMCCCGYRGIASVTEVRAQNEVTSHLLDVGANCKRRLASSGNAEHLLSDEGDSTP